MEKLKILIADDDVLAANSLKIIVEASGGFEVIALVHDGGEAYSAYADVRADICLLDIQMGEKSGLEAAENILALDPDAKIIFLTTFKDDDYIRRALEIGVKGYILKQDYNAIESAIYAVAEGQIVFGSEIVSKIPDLLKGSKAQSDAPSFIADSERKTRMMQATGLSEKELDCIAWVAQGLSNKEIAQTLYLSEGTIRNMISQILEKLDLRDRTQLAIYYLKQQLSLMQKAWFLNQASF